MRKLVIAATLTLVACSGSGTSSDVDWENYASSVRTRIDSMAASKDCAGLQAEFDTADANDDAQRERVGTGNADLMSYIDSKLSAAGCDS